MTRINLVPPEMLLDMHLRGEYKEITRVFTKVKNRIAKGQIAEDVDIPPTFTLNRGHETFFFNKLAFIFDRYQRLYAEMLSRGYAVDTQKYRTICASALEMQHTTWWYNYTPRQCDIYLSMARLAKMSKLEKVLTELSE